MRVPHLKYSTKRPEQRDISYFYGLSRQTKTVAGELVEMKNLCSENPGCITPRPKRSVYRTLTSGKALFAAANGKLCWVDGTNFYYDGVSKGSVTASAKYMADFFGKILIFPDKKYYDYNTDTFATMGSGTYPADGSVPDMDVIAVFENRVWGIKGFNVYASVYNDCLNWTQFSADPNALDDAIHIEITPDKGQIVGLIPLENHMLFATSHSTYEGYGNARNYIPQLVSNSRGTLSAKSMCEVDGRVFMLSRDGVNIYSGSLPRPVSDKLKSGYVSGISGTDGRWYYISLHDGNEHTLYAYDTRYTSYNNSAPSSWYKEDNLHVIDFAYTEGFLYALTASNQILKFNDSSSEEEITWEAETEEFNNNYLGNVSTYKIKIEALLSEGSEIDVYLKVSGGEYEFLDTCYYEKQSPHNYKIYMLPARSESFQVKFAGRGNAQVLSLVREVSVSTDKQ